jgi:peptidoglycan hydrolase-like protein with peptidoglycan-binding domain
MRFSTYLLSTALILAAPLPCSAMTHARRGPTSPRLFNKLSKRSKSKPTSQHVIDDNRATQIQTSLIKSGYLSGEASGHWDSATETAMQKFQSDNGWQTKLIPDSRAIIKLGLGPSHDSELSNSPSATAAPQTSSAAGFMQK